MSRSFSWIRRRVEPIGVDFGARVVRMLQLCRQRGGTTVIACGQRVLPPGPHAGSDGERLRAQAVAEILAEGGFVGRRAVTTLSWDELRVRNLRIPAMPESEMAEVVRYEAADRFGMEPGQAEFRFLVAGDVRQGTDLRQELIVFAAARRDMQAHVQQLAGMGLEPVAIDAGPCAVFRGFARFLRRDEDRGCVNAFVDLGYSASRVIVSRGPEVIFFKSVPIGGQRFDSLVSEQLELSPAEAAELRIRLHRQQVEELSGQAGRRSGDETVSDSTRRAVLDALRPAIDQLSKEIGLCLRYCSVTFRGLRSDQVTVVGGEACNSGLLQMLSDQVNVPFRVGRPMRNIGSEPDFGGADRRTGQPEWATALGLALKPVRVEQEAAA